MPEFTDKLEGKIRVGNGKCPAGHSLMTDKVLFDGQRAIVVKVKNKGHSSLLYLNPFYGKFEYKGEAKFEHDDVIEVFCPECGVSLAIDDTCHLCDISMFAVQLPDGGQVEACPKIGCHRHSLKIVDVDEQLGRMYVDETKVQM